MPRITACVLCGGGWLETILDMGEMPLPNRLPLPSDPPPDAAYPLRLVLCRSCGLLQLGDAVPPEEMFADYPYATGASAQLRAHFGALARTIWDRENLRAGHLVVDVGSNDGTLLSEFAALGLLVKGIDPAANLAALAAERGVPTEATYFDEEVGRRHRGLARVVMATNCLAHAADPPSFLRGVAAMLAPDGVFVAEVPYAWRLVDGHLWDTVYHEHRCYFGLAPLVRALPALGLRLVDAEIVDVHGGSLRLWARRARAFGQRESPRVAAILGAETMRAPASPASYQPFAATCLLQRAATRMALMDLPGASLVAGFGASAKASVLLNWCALGPETVAWVADANPLKQGRAIPGVRVPIVPERRLAEDAPSHVVDFVWNLADDSRVKLGALCPEARIVRLRPSVRIEEPGEDDIGLA